MKIKFQILIAFLLISTNLFSQSNNPLSGLKKAEPGDIAPGTPLMLNPYQTPMYIGDTTRIMGEDFMKYMMTNDYIPEPYVDSDKNVKAFVLRKATLEEKEMMRQMQQQGPKDITVKKEITGQTAAPFSLNDLSGAKYNSDQLVGKIIVLNFWFIECKPCVMEMPDLNNLVEMYKGKDVVFLGIATNNETRLKEFLVKNDFKYKIVANGMKTATDYGVTAYPTHIIIDQESKIAYSSVGIGPDTMENLKKTINDLLTKK